MSLNWKFRTEIGRLIRACDWLGASSFGGPLSDEEREILDLGRQFPLDKQLVASIINDIRIGKDPLGDIYCSIRDVDDRKKTGAFYTPDSIVIPMVQWVLSKNPATVVDAGCGSGRFAAEVIRRNINVGIVAVDVDPIATLICRAHLCQISKGQTTNIRILNSDFTQLDPSLFSSRPVAFIGNPPYVRHHDIDGRLKLWGNRVGKKFGMSFSGLSGLHAYFFLASALYSDHHDFGCFVTSSEWLDVKYGEFLRHLLIKHLGLTSLHLLSENAVAFQDAMTTAVITCFDRSQPYDSKRAVRVRLVDNPDSFGDLSYNGEFRSLSDFETSRWTPLIKNKVALLNGSSDGSVHHLIPLREIARVHRGVATGANHFFVMTREEAVKRNILEYTLPCVSRAKEIIESNGVLRSKDVEKVVLVIPRDLRWEDMSSSLRRYLEWGEAMGVSQRYLCHQRTPWWSLGEIRKPPILMTYMARRPPVFALNPDGLVLLNIAHGIFPREEWTQEEIESLVAYLNGSSGSFRGEGRTYHGGLEKFEPSEVESLLVPARA